MDNVKDETALEPYEPPTIEDMPIRAEEQVLAGCKQPGLSPGMTATACFNCRIPNGS